MYRYIIPSAFSIKRIDILIGNLLGLIQPLLKVLFKYFYKIYNSLYKRLQIGIYSSIQPFFKLIAQLYLKFYYTSANCLCLLTAPVRAVRSSRRHSHLVSCQEPVRSLSGACMLPGPSGTSGPPGPSGPSGLSVQLVQLE